MNTEHPNTDRATNGTLPPFRAPPVPYPRRVFVNRALRMESVEAVGFDMDYTLARYEPELEMLATELTLERLVALGYPKSIRALRYDPEFAIRGLVVDTQAGNLVKMDAHKHVTRAWHGLERVSQQERRVLYRSQALRLGTSRWAIMDTLFSMPEAFLFAHLVDLLEAPDAPGGPQRPMGPERWATLYRDIRASIDLAHRDDSLKSRVRADHARYLDRDPDLPSTLHRLRSAGKRLFILTNSDWDYTDSVMNHLLGGTMREYAAWTDFFDLIVVASQKPRFFEELSEPEPVVKRVWRGGGLAALERLLGVKGDKVVYVGDHIYGDVLRSKKSTVWRTVLIVPEMEHELGVIEAHRDALLRRSDLERERFDLELRLSTAEMHLQMVRRAERRFEQGLDGEQARSRVWDGSLLFRKPPDHWTAEDLHDERESTRAEIADLRHRIEENEQRARLCSQELDGSFDARFGMLLKEGHELSLFGGQVETYACAYTSRVSNLGAYSPAFYFRAPREMMPHERSIG